MSQTEERSKASGGGRRFRAARAKARRASEHILIQCVKMLLYFCVAFNQKSSSSCPQPRPRKCSGKDGWCLDHLTELSHSAGQGDFSLGAGPLGFPVPSAAAPPPPPPTPRPAQSAILSWYMLCCCCVPSFCHRCSALSSPSCPSLFPFFSLKTLRPRMVSHASLTQDLWVASPGPSQNIGKGVYIRGFPREGPKAFSESLKRQPCCCLLDLVFCLDLSTPRSPPRHLFRVPFDLPQGPLLPAAWVPFNRGCESRDQTRTKKLEAPVDFRPKGLVQFEL